MKIAFVILMCVVVAEGYYGAYGRHPFYWARDDAGGATAEGHKEEEPTPGAFESDMLLTPEQKAAIEQAIAETSQPEGGVVKRKAVRGAFTRWEDGIVPYVISSDSYSSIILAGIRHWEEHTCITFVPKEEGHSDYLSFIKGDGCYSYVGRIGGSQEISIGKDCDYLGTVAHEIGHAIGFYHEQSRPDRDDYVTINSYNIQDGAANNFKRYSIFSVMADVPYDLGSVMHYGKWYFSRNGQPTITAKDPSKGHLLGNREKLTFADVKLANLIYECNAGCSHIECLNGGYVGPDCTCICPPGFSGEMCEICDESSTDTTYYYRYRNTPLSPGEPIQFDVRASNDVHISLSPNPSDANQMYEIVIGGWKNTQSGIRRCKQCPDKVKKSTSNILKRDQWRSFWISYDVATGKLAVGKAGEAAFMTFTDPSPLEVRYLGYSTGWGSDGQFRFRCNQATCEAEDEFKCNTGGGCINAERVCDGYYNCFDKSDEEDCPCSGLEFACDDGSCIRYWTWECDNIVDCADGSDETNCD